MKSLRMLLALSFCISLTHVGHAWAIWQQDGTVVCTQPAVQEVPAVIPDGAGGVIVVWEDHRGFDADIYAQRMNGLGVLQWTAGGLAISAVPGAQLAPKICSDGAGGAIVTWEDRRSGNHLYAQRVSGLGVAQWTQNGVPVETSLLSSNPDIVPDGNGGAIISGTFFDIDQFVFAQRLNAAGVQQWTSNGVTVALGGEPAIAADDAGGAVITWTANGIVAQRLDGSGTRLWNPAGVTVAATQAMASRVIWVSGVGAIVTWSDHRLGSWDIYAQRLNPLGAPQWLANGAPVSLAGGDQSAPVIAPDGGSGAIITWADYRTGTADIYAQRVDSFGAIQWAASGAIVSTAADAQTNPRIVSDGAGGVVITWLDHRSGVRNDVYAQRLAGSGGGLWTVNGFPVSTAAGDKAAPAIAPDGSKSAIVAWADYRVPPNVYAQRIEFQYGYWGHPEAIVDYVTDMPADQGGKIMMEWQASQQDLPGGSLIDHYSVWVLGPQPLPWTEVGTVPATGQPSYMFDVTTFADATPGDPAVHQFKVIAHSLPSLEYSWESNIMDGFSVDNLPPAAPPSLVAQRLATGDVSLQWDGVADLDFDHYAVYRANTPGVTPTPVNFLAVSPGTTLLDSGAPPNALYYIVTAVDVHANEGGASNEAGVSGPTGVGDTPSLTTLTVLPNHPNPFADATELEIGLPHASEVSVEIFDVAGRRVNTMTLKGVRAGWRSVTLAGRNHAGTVLPSGVYFYRVRAGASTVTRKMVIAR